MALQIDRGYGSQEQHVASHDKQPRTFWKDFRHEPKRRPQRMNLRFSVSGLDANMAGLTKNVSENGVGIGQGGGHVDHHLDRSGYRIDDSSFNRL